MATISLSPSTFKLSRLGRKLNPCDDQRTIQSLPREVSERTWSEIILKEDVELWFFDLREQIVDNALEICYEKYMERQNACFAAYCAAAAWLKIIDWHYYRHDPGEDPSANPRCHIPKRHESWIPDMIPDASPRDSWSMQDLIQLETSADEAVQRWPSHTSLNYTNLEEIPSKYWFPGNVNLDLKRASKASTLSGAWVVMDEDDVESASTEPRSAQTGADSEVLQKVTDYGAEEISKVSSTDKTSTTMNLSSQGAGDSRGAISKSKLRRNLDEHKKRVSRVEHHLRKKHAVSSGGSRLTKLPPLVTLSSDVSDSRSRISIISDCRLRNFRPDIQYEISSEKVETPPGEILKRK